MKVKLHDDWYLKILGKSNVIDLPAAKVRTKIKSVRPTYVPEEAPTKISELVDLMTVKEVSKYLRCSLSEIYKLLRHGKLRCKAGGGKRLIPVTEVHAYLERCTKKIYG